MTGIRPRTLLTMLGVLLAICVSPQAHAQLNTLFSITNNPTNFDIPCGATECRGVTFRNISNRQVIITSIVAPTAPFSIDPTTPLTLPDTLLPNGTRSINYCYAPTVASPSDNQALAMVIDTGSVALARDTLRLQGISRAPQLSINPPSLNFGDVTIGSESCQQVTFTNTGNSPLTLDELTTLSAPFTPLDIPPSTLQPGSSASFQFCFRPSNTLGNRDTATFDGGGCQTPLNFVVTGRGLNPSPKVGPVLAIASDVTDFDTTRCGTTKSRSLTFRNTGTDPLTITSIDAILTPFGGSFGLPLAIQPNQERTFNITYSPTSSPQRDTQVVNLVGDNRVSLSIAMLFDVSGSMDIQFGARKRIDASHDRGQEFIGKFINDPARNVIDEGAVYQFSDGNTLLRDFTTDKVALQASVPDTTFGATFMYNATIRVAGDLGQRNQPFRRVIILLTDGINTGGSTLQDAINAATANGIRVYTIGIGSTTDVRVSDLTSLASATGGFFALAPDEAAMGRIFDSIALDLSRNQVRTFTLTGRSVAPIMTLAPTAIDFDTVRVGQSRCSTIIISNTGDAPLDVTTINGIIAPYTITGASFQNILPGGSAPAQICFAPRRLRVQTATGSFTYQRCAPETQQIALTGVGFDTLTVEIRDSVRGRPGSIVEFPVILRDTLPAFYEVDTYSLTVSYNKTMLYPAEPFVVSAGTLSQDMTPSAPIRSFEGPTATTQVSLGGRTLTNSAPNGTLVRLRFRVLHGDSLITPVSVTAATFADGNPRIGRVNPAFFIADSLCFQAERLIDASARFGGAVTKLSAPRGGVGGVTYHVHVAGQARVRLFNEIGGEVAEIANEWMEPGEYEHSFDISRLPSGVYYLHLQAGGSHDVKIFILSR